eukprot:COSAG01_NODE_67035_length_268_cov_0.615385_1_plen_33_part_10
MSLLLAAGIGLLLLLTAEAGERAPPQATRSTPS